MTSLRRRAAERAASVVGIALGERTSSFLLGLQWLFPAAILSRFFTGFATLAAARVMGPARFGEANLVLAATLWIQVPLLMGIPTALMHFVAKNEKNKSAWIGTALSALGFCSVITLVLGFAFAPAWARAQGILPLFFQWALLWCFGYTLYMGGTSLVSALERFRVRAVLDILFAVIMASLVATMYFQKKLDAFHYLMCLAIAYAVSGLAGLFTDTSVIKPHVDRHRLSQLLNYGAIATIGGVVNALLYSTGRLMANRYMTLGEVGVLSAYQAGSVQMASYLISIVVQAFFPLASRTPNQEELSKKMKRLLLLTAPLQVVAFGTLLVLYFALLGRAYPLIWTTAAVYVIAAVGAMSFGMLTWHMAAKGYRGILASSIIGLIAGLTNLVGCALLIPTWKVTGAGLASIGAAMVGVACCWVYGKWSAPQVERPSL